MTKTAPKTATKVKPLHKIFYYHFDPIGLWLVLNVALLLIIIVFGIKEPCAFLCSHTMAISFICLLSWALWGYKYIIKHPVAIISDKGIKIDHCRILRWQDIKGIEDKDVKLKCSLRHMPVMIIKPKGKIKYRYNWLQKHNCDFTPFSIPLYEIVNKKDSAEIRKIILQRIKK